MKIVQVPHSILSEKVKPVSQFDRRLATIVQKMVTTLRNEKDPEGVGLAANQVGLNMALFIMQSSKKAPLYVCINPKITFIEKIQNPTPQKKGKKTTRARLEGCLSIPRLWGYVARSPKVHLTYADLDGTIHEKAFTGFEAIIVQHEMDHLDGIVFTQRVIEQKRKLYQEIDGELEPLKI
ncbi:MAG: Peptide deformylase [Microgenomates bacterium OLB23]|nr:MAG: Peptide deformylase [Microgenomates bacterium OLB23]